MNRNITVAELQAAGAQILRALSPGEELTIIHNDEALAHIRPAIAPRSDKPRVPGSFKGKVWLADDFDVELPDASATGVE